MIRILLIEDDMIDRKTLSRELVNLHYSYEIVASLTEARACLQKGGYDVIVSDYLLNDGTAFDILTEYPTIPVIIITGAGAEDTAVQAIKMGAYDYLVKDLNYSYVKKIPIAIENAVAHHRIIEAEREQRAFAEAMQDIVTVLNSTLELDEVLTRILQNVQRVVPHDVSNIMLVEGGVARVVHTWSRVETVAATEIPVSIPGEPYLHSMMTSRQPFLLSETPMSNACLPATEGTGSLYSYAGAPIFVNDRVIGFLNLCSITPNFYTPRHAERLQAFAGQAAVALQNARMYQQAKELAAFQERQRLARDLHDSVTQTLFSTHAFAEATLRLWEIDPTGIGGELVQLSRLTRGALAEMRTLLLELNPQALMDADLADLLVQLGDNMAGRTSIQVKFKVARKVFLPPEIQVALYRIGQEALNNAEKYSGAKHVRIELLSFKSQVMLYIEDDGRGFNSTAIPQPGIMREHASAAGIHLVVDSQPGKGTRVIASWHRNRTNGSSGKKLAVNGSIR